MVLHVKYSTEKPPNNLYELCHEVFKVKWEEGITITYKNTIYSATTDLPEDLRVHEETHVHQQLAIGADEWWSRYFVDKEFRLAQEVEAYRNQVKYIREHYSRNKRKAMESFYYQFYGLPIRRYVFRR